MSPDILVRHAKASASARRTPSAQEQDLLAVVEGVVAVSVKRGGDSGGSSGSGGLEVSITDSDSRGTQETGDSLGGHTGDAQSSITGHSESLEVLGDSQGALGGS